MENIVVLNSEGRYYGICVDSILDTQEIKGYEGEDLIVATNVNTNSNQNHNLSLNTNTSINYISPLNKAPERITNLLYSLIEMPPN